MDASDEVRTLALRVAQLERERRSMAARLDLLEASVNVARHGMAEQQAEVRRLRKALQLAEAELAGVGILIACGSEEAPEAVTRAQAIIVGALRDPE